MKILGYDISKAKPPVDKRVVIPEEAVTNFEQYMSQMRQTTGKTDVEILKNTFLNPWMGMTVEETDAFLRLDAQAMGKDEGDGSKKDPIEECIRLRHKFAPINTCVEYVKQQLIGGGISTIIKDAKDKNQISMQEDIDRFIDNVYQDEYTQGLNILLPIVVDYALTTGVGAAEIAYLTNVDFWKYVTLKTPEKVVINDKTIEVVDFDIKTPNWVDLKGIKRLKIFKDGYKLFEPQRDNASMEIKYWTVDDKSGEKIILNSGQSVRKYDPTKPKQGLYLHSWQLFYLSINRPELGVKGESIILPALSTALTLEKVLAAVGEGSTRAGFKRFFIIMGSEKRPWGGPFIRNVLQQMKEAKEKNWSTIPMPQGFDIKEMGGEVFDAKEVVDYLLKMIAKTMNVPCSVLGVSIGSGAVEEPSSYKVWKNNLLSAIRTQLFKRHLFAMHGDKRKKQGGTEDDTYIPYPRVTTEQLLTLKERTKLFQDLMNIANPLNPITKLKNEIEFCKVMGWDDVIKELPTLEEYANELKRQKKLQEKQALDAQKAKTEAVENPSQPQGMAGEKFQGVPKPQTEEQQKTRQEGGVSVRPADSKKGKIESKPI